MNITFGIANYSGPMNMDRLKAVIMKMPKSQVIVMRGNPLTAEMWGVWLCHLQDKINDWKLAIAQGSRDQDNKSDVVKDIAMQPVAWARVEILAKEDGHWFGVRSRQLNTCNH